MAEVEQRLQNPQSPQSPGSGNASVPADWQRRPSNRQAKISFEDTASRSRMRDSKQIYPDNASLVRAGRQFTVGNIGNNGRIYLRYDAFFQTRQQAHNHCRPVIRPGIERSRPPPPPFLLTPRTPSNAEPDIKDRQPANSNNRDTLLSSITTSSKTATQITKRPINDAENTSTSAHSLSRPTGSSPDSRRI